MVTKQPSEFVPKRDFDARYTHTKKSVKSINRWRNVFLVKMHLWDRRFVNDKILLREINFLLFWSSYQRLAAGCFARVLGKNEGRDSEVFVLVLCIDPSIRVFVLNLICWIKIFTCFRNRWNSSRSARSSHSFVYRLAICWPRRHFWAKMYSQCFVHNLKILCDRFLRFLVT